MTEGAADAVFAFEATILHWRGPSPYFFAPIPVEQAARLAGLARTVSYGWGVIPVAAEIAGVAFTTSLFPKDMTYLLPIKAEVRRRAGVTAGDVVGVRMTLGRDRSVRISSET